MLDLLNALSKNELVSFEKFLCSPFYNSNNRIVNLYKFLKLKLSSVELEEPSREEIFTAAFGKEKYNDGRYRKLVFEFTSLFEKFLSVIKFEKKIYLKEIILIEELDERRIDRLFEPEARKLLKKLNESISKDDEYYSAYFNLLSMLVYYHYDKDTDKSAEFLKAKAENIDLHYMFAKLHLFHEMMMYNELQGNKKEFNFNFFNEIDHFIEKNRLEIKDRHPNLYFIFLTIRMHSNDDDKYSDEFLKYLNGLKDVLPREKLAYYYAYIATIYWNRIKRGDIQHRKLLFSIYKTMVKEDILLIDSYLPDSKFNSMVMIGVSQKDFKWTEDFIEKYRSKIEPSKAKDAVNLAYAKMFFYRKNYDDAINYLNSVEFKNTIYFINSKLLLGKIYYDKDDLTYVNYILDSLNHYVRRNKQLIPEQAIVIKTFVKYMRELIKYRENEKKNTVVLKKEIDNEKDYVPDRNWFYEKIDELEG